jgi:hypothetical protein
MTVRAGITSEFDPIVCGHPGIEIAAVSGKKNVREGPLAKPMRH